jgi:hypothetical protein
MYTPEMVLSIRTMMIDQWIKNAIFSVKPMPYNIYIYDKLITTKKNIKHTTQHVP